MGEPGRDVVDELRRAGVVRGDLVALAVAAGVGVGIAATTPKASLAVARRVEDPAAVFAVVEVALRPRWVLWSSDTAANPGPRRGADRDMGVERHAR